MVKVPFEYIHIFFLPPVVNMFKPNSQTVRPHITNGYYGKVYKICRENFNEGLFAGLTTDGKTIFIDVIDVGCKGVNGFRWLKVECVMNRAINMNEVKDFFSFCEGVVKHSEAFRCCFRLG